MARTLSCCRVKQVCRYISLRGERQLSCQVVFLLTCFYHFARSSLANGPYFEAAVEVMARTCCEAEQSRNYNLLVRAGWYLLRDAAFSILPFISFVIYVYSTNRFATASSIPTEVCRSASRSRVAL
jgi:hypothetical protein